MEMETQKLLESIQNLFNIFNKGNNDLSASKIIEEIKKAKAWDKMIESDNVEIQNAIEACKENSDEKFNLFKEIFMHEIENQYPKFLASKSVKLTIPQVVYDKITLHSQNDKKDNTAFITDILLDYLNKRA